MIQKETIEFLQDLHQHNVKTWFDENRKRYERARTNFLDVTTQLIVGIEAFDEAIASTSLDPKKTLMRINRDIRFSKDKSPYNPRFFTTIGQGGKSAPFAGYYFNLAPGESFYGGGLYMPDNKILQPVRTAIEYRLSEWEEIVHAPQLSAAFGSVLSNGELKRPPKGFDKESPALAWIKWKGFYTKKDLSDADLIQPDFVETMIRDLQALYPLISFLNESINQPT